MLSRTAQIIIFSITVLFANGETVDKCYRSVDLHQRNHLSTHTDTHTRVRVFLCDLDGNVCCYVCVCVCCSRVITEDYKVPDRMVGFSEYDL